MTRPAQAFISYSSRDREIVLPLVRCLVAGGLEVWVDQGGIEAATSWADRIIAALDAAEVALFCLSNHSCSSEEVFRELSYASGAKKRLVPVLLEDVELPRRFKYHLAGLQFVQVHQVGPEQAALDIVRGLLAPVGEGPSIASSPAPQPVAPSPTIQLPQPPHALIGRDREVREVSELLSKHRLVTLTGPGGTGKTRLSIEVARILFQGSPALALGKASPYEGGVWFIELATVTHPSGVHPAITRTLGLREAETGEVLEALRVFLRDRAALLVLDNFEQISGGAVEVAALLKKCPTVRVLVSSRIPLRVYGEHEYAVSPLGTPGTGDPKLEAIAASGAVQLFLERARAIRPNLELDEATAPAIAAICRRLDGLPLALELAAARIRILTPQALAARLERSLDLLTGGSRDLPERQQTLRGAIAWSYDLLTPEDRALFELLGAFRGGWSLDSVEQIAGPFLAGDAFDRLATLVEGSLVRQEELPTGEPRFRMLEMIREFAAERLSQSDRACAALAAHRAHFLAVAEAQAPRLFGAGQTEALTRIEVDLDNMRAVIDRARVALDAPTALRMCAALWYFWAIRGYFNEGREQLGAALDASGHMQAQDPVVTSRATCLNASAMLTYFQGDYVRMTALADACVPLALEAGDAHNHAFGLAVLGVASYCAGERDRGRTASQQGLRLAEELGDLWVQGFAWNVAAIIDYMDGHLAIEPWEKAHQILTSLNDRYWGTYPRIGLGFVLQSRDRHAESAPLFFEALRVCHSMSNLRGTALSLAGLAGARIRGGDHRSAALLLGGSEAIRDSIRSPIPAIYRPICEKNDAELRAHLEPAVEQQERQTGARLPLEDLLARVASLR